MSKNNKINIKLQERDKKIILECCRYKGLPNKSIAKKHFKNDNKVCNNRLLKLEKAGYLKKTNYIEALKNNIDINNINNEQNGLLLKGHKKVAIYYPLTAGKKAIEYKLNVAASKFKPKKEELDKHLLLGRIYEKVTSLVSSSESHTRYIINNTVPVLCSIPAEKLLVVTALNKQDMSRPSRKENIITMVKKHAITSDLPVMFIVTAPAYIKDLTLHDIYYLPWNTAPGVLYNLSKDTDYYKRSFQQVFLDAGYTPLDNSGLYWQVIKNGQSYNIAELVTGSTELMRSLRQPKQNTYIYIISRSHLYGVSLEQGYSFLVYSWKDKTTYEVTTKDNKHHFKEIKKGALI